MSAMQLPLSLDGFVPVPLAEANAWLECWGHNLGPVNRPFGSQSWLFLVAGEPMACAVGASIVSSSVTRHKGHGADEPCTTGCWRYRRGEVVELARLCSAERWATRLMLRWWREVGALRWPYWPVNASVAYSQSYRHEGRIYRHDGWDLCAEDAGSSGGGGWSTKRTSGDEVLGTKRRWMHCYRQPSVLGEPARRLGPSLDLRPVPGGQSADRPPGRRERRGEGAVTPHGDGAGLDPQPLGDVALSDRLALLDSHGKNCSGPLYNLPSVVVESAT